MSSAKSAALSLTIRTREALRDREKLPEKTFNEKLGTAEDFPCIVEACGLRNCTCSC